MIISDDIYMTAYLQTAGLRITDIKLTPNIGGQKVEFVLTGEEEEKIAEDFKNENAIVNIKQYLYQLFELREVMYSVKNDKKTLRTTTGAPHGKQRFKIKNRDI
jgi:hypothetical protein